MARKGTRVVSRPGNHDEALREYVGTAFGDIELSYDHVYTHRRRRSFLLIHGDGFDQVTPLSPVGGGCSAISPYNALVRINTWLSSFAAISDVRATGRWPATRNAKVKSAVSFIYDFEDSVIRAVREREVDGVICGPHPCRGNQTPGGWTHLRQFMATGSTVAPASSSTPTAGSQLVDWGMTQKLPEIAAPVPSPPKIARADCGHLSVPQLSRATGPEPAKGRGPGAGKAEATDRRNKRKKPGIGDHGLSCRCRQRRPREPYDCGLQCGTSAELGSAARCNLDGRTRLRVTTGAERHAQPLQKNRNRSGATLPPAASSIR